jgi:hypothetical protein
MFERFISEEVWNCTLKYTRMMRITKEKFFTSLLEGKSTGKYSKELKELWNIDHNFMNKALKELDEMVKDKDIKLARKYGDDKVVQRSIKLENSWQEYNNIDYGVYKLNPERDFTIMEQRYVNRHIKYYESTQKGLGLAQDKETYLSKIVKKYDKIDKSIPYFSHTTGKIVSYQTIATYNSMLYNWNLTHSAWNRTEYDAKKLGNNLQYLVAHPYACPHCMEYQGFVYADDTPTNQEYKVLIKYGKRGEYMKEDAIKGGVGHPNCKHSWTIFWDIDQLQDDKFNSSEWEEEYKKEQKKQSLDLEKSRLLSDRRIYKELGDQSKVDELTTKIKAIRDKKKEL